MRRLLPLLLVALGCGSSSNSAPDAAPADAASSACTFTGFAEDSAMAERDGDLEVLFYTALTSEERLGIDFYFSIGATDGPQSQSFTGEGLDTCSLCMLIRSECSGLLCDTRYMAQSGSLQIDAMDPVGGTFSGSLSDVVLAEVTIDSGTQETTLVPSGRTWCLPSYQFNVNVVAP